MGKEEKGTHYQHRKAQMTAFGIFAVVILVGAVLITYLGRQQSGPRVEVPKQVTHPQHVQAVKDLIASCADHAAKNAVMISLATAGYADSPPGVFAGIIPVTYLYEGGKSFLPSEEKVKDGLRKGMEASVRECADFSHVANVEVRPESMTASPQIENGKITFSMRYPLVIKRDQTSYRLDDSYAVTVPVNMKEMILHAGKIVNEVKNNPKYVPITEMISEKFYVQANPIDEKIMLYQIVDVGVTLDEVNPTFLFATKR